MKDTSARSGYNLAAKILESHPNDAIETMLKFSGNGAECDWLEFKASMTLLQGDKDKGETEELLHWKYVKSLAAIANTRGGAFVIGVADATHEAVPLSSDGELEEYYRMMILGKLEKAEKKYSKNNRKCSLKKSITKDLEPRYVPYNGTTVLVFLVKPCRLDDDLYYIKEESDNRSFTILPYRVKGCGEVKELTDYHDIQRYVKGREELLASTDLSSAWAELEVEHQASKADEMLDNAIRAYYVKLEENTRKRLQAFVPLDAAGGDESNDDEEIEYEDPTAVSVFDEDDDMIDGDVRTESSRDTDAISNGDEELDESELDDESDENDGESQEPQTIRMGLSELLVQYDRVVLSGEPGAGKTTSLAHFAVERGKKQGDRPHLFAFIQLGRWAAGGSVLGLVAKTCGLSFSQIEKLLEEKRLHLILDALNECPDHLRPAALANIRILVREHPDLPVVLSMRRASVLRLSGFPVFKVQAMDRDRQRQFLERHLGSVDKAAAILDALEMQPGGASIAQNPMLLKMVVDVVRNAESLPSGCATLYRAWLEKWYAIEEKKARKSKAALPWTATEAMRLLARMAFAGRAHGYRDIPIDIARHSLGDKDGTFFERLCQGPLLEIDEGFVHFRHETFQEYLCAEWLLAEPTALNVLPEKDYDTWGMPIAYAAELRLPNKLPEEMSEAVWEMNPWIAALVAVSPSRTFDSVAEKPPEMVLGNAIYHKANLLSDELHEAFLREITRGTLFQQADPPLSYAVLYSEDSRETWASFECAFVLNMPPQGIYWRGETKDEILCRNSRRRKYRAKTLNMLILSQESVIFQVKRFFPKVSFFKIFQGWYWFLQNPSVMSTLEALNKCIIGYPDIKPLPVEIMSLLPRVNLNGRRGGEKIEMFSDLFGPDFISRMLISISSHPSLWVRPGIDKLLMFANKRRFPVHEAARSIFFLIAQYLEESGIVPVSMCKSVASVCQLLNESDVPFLLPRLSPFGQALLKRFAFNPRGKCDPFYKNLPDVGVQKFKNIDLKDVVKRREIATILLCQEFSMLVSDIDTVKRKHGEKVIVKRALFRNDNFPEGVRCRNYGLPIGQEAPVRGSQCLVRVAIVSRKGKYCFGVESIRLVPGIDYSSVMYRKSDLVDPLQRQRIKSELKQVFWEMQIVFVSENRDYLFFRHPSFSDNIYCPASLTRYRDVFEVGQVWNSKVSVRKSKRDASFGFVVWSVKPVETDPGSSFKNGMPDAMTVSANSLPSVSIPPASIPLTSSSQNPMTLRDKTFVSHLNNAMAIVDTPPLSEVPTVVGSATIGKTENEVLCTVPKASKVSPAVEAPSCVLYRESDLIDPVQRRRIENDLEIRGRLKMTIVSISENRESLVFKHPLFQEGICCSAESSKYHDLFGVGQVWRVKVRVNQNAKDGTFCFVARRIKPLRRMPNVPMQQKPVAMSVRNEPMRRETCRLRIADSSHISIYIDETWPGTQNHAYKDIGVIGGVVAPWEGIEGKRLPVIPTHLSNGSVARNAIQAMLAKPDVFPFVFPIKWDRAVKVGGRMYFELVQHALMLLLGWMLPRRDRLTTVDIYLEHISGFEDGHDETDFINSLAQAMRLLSGGRRFANWQIRRVEWVDKGFGYVPYGDLVCKTCVPHAEQQMLARAVNVREWDGYLPFSKGVFPLLRDMDTASPSGFADLLIAFAKEANDTPFFRHVRKLAVERAQSDTTFRDAVFSRFEACYSQPSRDISLLNRVVPHFLEEFPTELFKDRPRMQMLRILIGFQHANHNGDPDLASALVGEYQSLRPRVLELDRDLCAYADLNLAVHEHDAFDFDNALSIVDGWINDPLFPALSVMNRGRMFSSLGQSLALMGRNQEAGEAFARALAQFAAEPELLAKDIEQTKTYQVMNVLEQDAPSAVPLLEGLLGKTLLVAALNFAEILEKPFFAHLFLKSLWRMRSERSVVLDAWLKNLPAEIAIKGQHPYELILFYLALLTKDANPAYAQARAEELEQFFAAIEFGGTLGLIHAYIRVMLKSHGFNVVADKDFLDELAIVEQYLPKARAVIDKLRTGWGDPSMSVEGILPFNYC